MIYSKPLVIDINSKSHPHRLFMIYVSHWSLVQVTNTNDIHCQNHSSTKINNLFETISDLR